MTAPLLRWLLLLFWRLRAAFSILIPSSYFLGGDRGLYDTIDNTCFHDPTFSLCISLGLLIVYLCFVLDATAIYQSPALISTVSLANSRSLAPLATQRLPGPLCINTTNAQIGPSPAIAAPTGAINITILVALLRVNGSYNKKDTATAPYSLGCVVVIHYCCDLSSNLLLPLYGSKRSYLFLPCITFFVVCLIVIP
ncbi:hypothetical protein GW17_00052142 [Ensete ventricosum]|nr:hypothetical protein GW17_00052142 [Ensete ventricosum]RZS00153.1 hypothetical protein BHM03_00029802 [Ensete ventricosum]